MKHHTRSPAKGQRLQVIRASVFTDPGLLTSSVRTARTCTASILATDTTNATCAGIPTDKELTTAFGGQHAAVSHLNQNHETRIYWLFYPSAYLGG